MKALLSVLSLFILLSACKDDSSKESISLPNTPGEVAKTWVTAFYNDDFPKAVVLGTDLTRMMIDSVKKEMEPNAPSIAFSISDVSCETAGDSAWCTYIYKEEMDKYEEYVSLLKVNGQWLVNEAWDSSSEVEQEFDLIREEIERMMKEETEENEQ